MDTNLSIVSVKVQNWPVKIVIDDYYKDIMNTKDLLTSGENVTCEFDDEYITSNLDNGTQDMLSISLQYVQIAEIKLLSKVMFMKKDKYWVFQGCMIINGDMMEDLFNKNLISFICYTMDPLMRLLIYHKLSSARDV